MSVRAWESTALTAPWLAGQGIYDRVVSIRRPIKPVNLGAIAYGGLNPINETVILTGIPASIQIQRQRGFPEAHVPGDAPDRGGWRIFLPSAYLSGGQPTLLPAGIILDRDIVADDLGRRFIIIMSCPNLLGYELNTELLEA